MSGRRSPSLSALSQAWSGRPDAPGQPSRHVTRAADKPGLFAAIRREAQDRLSTRALAARHRVHRRTIRQALAGRRRARPRRGVLLSTRCTTRSMAMLTAEPGLPIRHVWERLLDEHDTDVSYTTVRDYVMRLRAGTPGQGQ